MKQIMIDVILKLADEIKTSTETSRSIILIGFDEFHYLSNELTHHNDTGEVARFALNYNYHSFVDNIEIMVVDKQNMIKVVREGMSRD